MERVPFSALSLSKEILKAIADMGFEQTTPIQAQAIPAILEGHDVTGQSSTGTGKTVAFAVPLVEQVHATEKHIQALILCPTRELCIQVCEEVAKLTRYKKGLSVLPIYGGQDYERQFQGLRQGSQIIVGTPGRLMDHMRRGTIQLSQVAHVVLDEADEMLDMGFQEDLEFILKAVPDTRQTVLFSATLPPAIRSIIKRFQIDPVNVRVSHETMTVPQVRQMYLDVRRHEKLEVLCRCLDLHHIKLGIVFCNTRLGVDELVSHLQARGYASEGLHGDCKQAMRDRVMNRFRSGQVEILVATDVASRGIDVKNVEAVFNYDLPKDEEDYVHRIGRTGRAGASGLAISLVCGKELYKLRDIERYMKAKVTRQPIPSLDDVEASVHSVLLEKVKAVLQEGQLEKYIKLAEGLVQDEITPMDVAGALLKMALPPPSDTDPMEQRPSEDEGKGSRRGEERRSRSGSSRSDGEGRGDRGERGEGRGRALDSRPGQYESIFLNVGRMHGIKPKDVLGALAGESGVAGSRFGAISIQAKHTLVEAPADQVEQIIEAMQGARIRQHQVRVRRDNF